MKYIKHVYILLLVGAILLSLNGNISSLPFFGDQAWFYISAKDALLTGKFPLLGITTSITWLHQGPLWTYLLIPGLVFSGFHPASGIIFTSILYFLCIPLLFYLTVLLTRKRRLGIIAVLVWTFSPLLAIYSRLAYHTSPIIPLLIITILLLLKRKYFFSGLFIGFLYQLHLLTFIYWPVYLYLLFKQKGKVSYLIMGFITGILPFILSGPIQTVGIFVWIFAKIITGFSPSHALGFYFHLTSDLISPILLPPTLLSSQFIGSEAYFVVFSLPIILVFSYVIFSLRKFGFVILSVLIIGNIYYTINNHYLAYGSRYGTTLSDKLNLSRHLYDSSITNHPQISISSAGGEFASASMPYEYLVWWLSRSRPPLGSNSVFTVDESNQSYRVLK